MGRDETKHDGSTNNGFATGMANTRVTNDERRTEQTRRSDEVKMARQAKAGDGTARHADKHRRRDVMGTAFDCDWSNCTATAADEDEADEDEDEDEADEDEDGHGTERRREASERAFESTRFARRQAGSRQAEDTASMEAR